MGKRGEADHDTRSAERDWRMFPLREVERELAGRGLDPRAADKKEVSSDLRREAKRMRRLLRGEG